MLTIEKVQKSFTKEKIEELMKRWRKGGISLEELNEEFAFMEEKEEDSLVYRTLGAFVDTGHSLFESILYELETERQIAVDNVGLMAESTGKITICGRKKIIKSFSRDIWSSYDENDRLKESWWGKEHECPSPNWAFAEWCFNQESNHTELFAEGGWSEIQYIEFPENMEREEIFKIFIDFRYLGRSRGFKTPKIIQAGWPVEFSRREINNHQDWWKRTDYDFSESEEEAEILGLESLIPANCGVSLWD